MIPRFFDVMTIDLGAPIYIDKSENRESARKRVESAMNAPSTPSIHIDAKVRRDLSDP